MHCSDGTVVLHAITGLFSFSRPPVPPASVPYRRFLRLDARSLFRTLGSSAGCGRSCPLPAVRKRCRGLRSTDFAMPESSHIAKLQIVLTILAVGPPLPHEPCGRESEQERQSNAPFHQPFVDVIIPRYSFLKMLQRTMDPVPVPVEHRFVAIYVL